MRGINIGLCESNLSRFPENVIDHEINDFTATLVEQCGINAMPNFYCPPCFSDLL